MSEREPRPEDEAHDVLAAEAFAVPTSDPSLRHRPVTLPAVPAPGGRLRRLAARSPLGPPLRAMRRAIRAAVP